MHIVTHRSVCLTCLCQVVAVGPGAMNKEGGRFAMSVAVGDKVLLPEYGGHTVKLGDDELSLFRDEDILGKFE